MSEAKLWDPLWLGDFKCKKGSLWKDG